MHPAHGADRPHGIGPPDEIKQVTDVVELSWLAPDGAGSGPAPMSGTMAG